MLEGNQEPYDSPDSSEASSSWIFNNKVRLLIVGVVMALSLGFLISEAFPGNTRYYLTVGEFWASGDNQDGRSVRVVGQLVPDSFHREQGGILASFQVANDGQVLDASYEGVVPDLFFNVDSEIVLEGNYGTGETFHVDDVAVKCPSKYEALESA